MAFVFGRVCGFPFGKASPFDAGAAARGCCDWVGSVCWRLLMRMRMRMKMKGRVCFGASGCVAALEEWLGCGSGTFVEQTRVGRRTLPAWMPFFIVLGAIIMLDKG